jgi:hypothetical protein
MFPIQGLFIQSIIDDALYCTGVSIEPYRPVYSTPKLQNTIILIDIESNLNVLD